MNHLLSIGSQIAARRKSLGLTQSELGIRAGVSRATLDLLENGRCRELGFNKIARILSVMGLELKLQEASLRRPTMEELLEEDRNDQSVDRRS